MAARPKSPKRKAQLGHARRRAAQRFGLTVEGVDAAVRQMRTGKATFLFAESRRIAYWRISLPDGRSAVMVYDRTRKQPVTFLEHSSSFEQ